MKVTDISGYVYDDSSHSGAHSYLMPAVLKELEKLTKTAGGGAAYIRPWLWQRQRR